MKVLSSINPTPEQLKILETDTYRLCVIRGSAGSGKTSAAALRCRKVLAGIAADRRLNNDPAPIKLAVLTFNRTLKGYIENFVEEQLVGLEHPVECTIDTFAGWAIGLTRHREVIENKQRAAEISSIWSKVGQGSALGKRFIADEVQYALGRFRREALDEYIKCERIGRGTPTLREARKISIVREVITPYLDLLAARDLGDWSDYAEQVLAEGPRLDFDAIVADEVQDFSVQDLRAIFSRMKAISSVTLVLDTAQSIYPRGIVWSEVGVDLRRDADVHQLRTNYRNSPQIAQFVQPLLTGMRMGDDATLPDYTTCRGKPGRTPTLISGRFEAQVTYALSIVKSEVDLTKETVGILTLWGDTKGHVGRSLDANCILWCTLKQQKDWPKGPANVGVSTLNSAKGLEFDHVFILGFDTDFLDPHGADAEDAIYSHQRRLLAMAVTRAKRTVVIGYRQKLRSDILDLFDPNTYLVELA